MKELSHYWLLILLFLMMMTMGVLVLWPHKKQKCVPTPMSDDLVEKIARAMCAADGRNPDGSGGMRERHTDGNPGRYQWELYKDQARRYLAAQAVFFRAVMGEIKEPEASASSES